MRKPFVLDSASQRSRMREYQPLEDVHLYNYFGSPIVRKTLRRGGLVTNTGEVIQHSYNPRAPKIVLPPLTFVTIQPKTAGTFNFASTKNTAGSSGRLGSKPELGEKIQEMEQARGMNRKSESTSDLSKPRETRKRVTTDETARKRMWESGSLKPLSHEEYEGMLQRFVILEEGHQPHAAAKPKPVAKKNSSSALASPTHVRGGESAKKPENGGESTIKLQQKQPIAGQKKEAKPAETPKLAKPDRAKAEEAKSIPAAAAAEERKASPEKSKPQDKKPSAPKGETAKANPSKESDQSQPPKPAEPAKRLPDTTLPDPSKPAETHQPKAGKLQNPAESLPIQPETSKAIAPQPSMESIKPKIAQQSDTPKGADSHPPQDSPKGEVPSHPQLFSSPKVVEKPADNLPRDETTPKASSKPALAEEAKIPATDAKPQTDAAQPQLEESKPQLEKQQSHPDAQKASIDRQKSHPDESKPQLEKQKSHPDVQKPTIDRQKSHPDESKSQLEKQKSHPDVQKPHIDESKPEDQQLHSDEAKLHQEGEKHTTESQPQMLPSEVPAEHPPTYNAEVPVSTVVPAPPVTEPPQSNEA